VLPQPSALHWLSLAQTGMQAVGLPKSWVCWQDPGKSPPLQSLSVVHGFKHQNDIISSL
jgi:hypothetical protein